ncbi:NERD domain-containing protein [Cytobacillus depressus]|uniref:NERD domain-containing protein n=1 Tax=Cytobacillus depressus TaxID=1602942 RepID=A0A6L3UYS1_9BACI|nr:nuclease-related domain-containing protein [Cytobacillus depressus]KAB2329253.1 NERD domain-containing protein [Cytobacillus depressus]
MYLKPRAVSNELEILRSLNIRMNLPAKDRKHYLNLEKGYQGEAIFDQLTAKLQCDVYILNDLCFEFNRSVFQIDTLIISQNTIFPIEIKNYEGDYHYDPEVFRRVSSNYEITNPLDQLKRSMTLLRSLLKFHGIHQPIEGYVTFVNPEFTLYQAPLNTSMILPTQLNRFNKTLNEMTSKLSNQHKKLADLLISLHQTESPYTRLPTYNYEHLKKGISCISCYSYEVAVIAEKKIVCDKCSCVEDVNSAVLRNVEELKTLFPDKKLTTTRVHEWCKVIKSKKTIRRILIQNLRSVGESHLRYFV